MMLPILYTFVRCPYAIRARLALHSAKIDYEAREVDLRRKPQSLIAASPKGTVPILILPSGSVLEQSLDIMSWALSQSDPEQWLRCSMTDSGPGFALVQKNDFEFKPLLDRYKYAARFPEFPASWHRDNGTKFIEELENRLGAESFLMGRGFTWVDAAIFPFVRQFAGCDPAWWSASAFVSVRRWMSAINTSDLMTAVMIKKLPFVDA